MQVNNPTGQYWNNFSNRHAEKISGPPYDVFYFGDNQQLADELLELVLLGKKTATASLPQEFAERNLRLPEAGDLSIVTDWHGTPHCIIETISAVVLPFSEVGASFAILEGEGDLSLSWWREAHWQYFTALCREKQWEVNETMPVVCETFKLVFSEPWSKPG